MKVENVQKPYVTLAQSKQAAGCFVPVIVDHRGARSLPITQRSNTITAMATTCKMYAWHRNLPVLFSRHLATLPIPADVMEQLQALVDDEVERVLR